MLILMYVFLHIHINFYSLFEQIDYYNAQYVSMTLLNISIICKSKIDNKISNTFANTLLFITRRTKNKILSPLNDD